MKIILLLFLISLIKTEIENDSTYIITSASDNGLALMPKDSRPGWVGLVLFDLSKTPSQKWHFRAEDNGYSSENTGTGFFLHHGEEIANALVDQNQNDNTEFYRWKLRDAGDGAYRIETVKELNGDTYFVTADEIKRGAGIHLKGYDEGNKNQIWKFEKVDNIDFSSFTKDMANEVGHGYLNKYWVNVKQSDGKEIKSVGGGFWTQAEMIEMLLDGYENIGDNIYKEAFEGTYQDELDNIGNRYTYWTGMTETDWNDNPYNDDIMWLVLASVRAYFLFGNGNEGFTNYLEYAKHNFQIVMDRGTLSDGTIRWCQEADKGDTTTSCINGPSTVAACYLAEATGEGKYYDKAKEIHAAQRKRMIETDTGKVLDSPDNNWPSCYNQGTWIGACVLLYNHFGDEEYFEDAVKAMEYLIKDGGHFSDNYGVLQVETATEGDLAAFRSILFRYVRMFIKEFKDRIDVSPYLRWLEKNAKVAYNNRNINGIVQTPFNFATDRDMDFKRDGMSGGVSCCLNMVWE